MLTASASPNDSSARLEHVCALEEVDAGNVRGSLGHPESATVGGKAALRMPLGHRTSLRGIRQEDLRRSGIEPDAPGPGHCDRAFIRLDDADAVVVEQCPTGGSEAGDGGALTGAGLAQDKVRTPTRTDRARGMEHQVAPQGYDTRHHMVEQKMRDEIGVTGLLGDERHAFPGELERRPVRELDRESVADPVLDRPRVVRVVSTAMTRDLWHLTLGRQPVHDIGGASCNQRERKLDRAREHEAVDEVVEIGHHSESR